MKKGFVAGVAAVLALLLAEGLPSLFDGPTLGARWRAFPALPRPGDEERFAAAARSPGSYRVHPDPLVGGALKADFDFEIHGARGRSDRLGLRRRPEAEPPEGAEVVRVVVLGDSVAFGYGLTDGETLAAVLEDALADARGQLEPRAVCRTVALPGWNWRNEFHFLRDHFDELDPDLVLYLPIGNDLANTRVVNETGQASFSHDLGAEDPWLVASTDFAHTLAGAAFRGQLRGASLADLGPAALTADLSPGSSRRYDAMARAVLELENFLADRQARLVVVYYEWTRPMAILAERWLSAGLAAPSVPFLLQPQRADTLGDDPHPNARTVAELARHVARFLLAGGFLSRGAGPPVPPLAPSFAQRLAPSPTLESCAREAADSRALDRAALSAHIEWESARGLGQVFGDLSPFGVVATRLLAVLPSGGRAVQVTLAALPTRPDLYPLRVQVEIDGAVREPLQIGVGERVERTNWLDAPPAAPFEVRLVPERWCVLQYKEHSGLASFQFVSLTIKDR